MGRRFSAVSALLRAARPPHERARYLTAHAYGHTDTRTSETRHSPGLGHLADARPRCSSPRWRRGFSCRALRGPRIAPEDASQSALESQGPAMRAIRPDNRAGRRGRLAAQALNRRGGSRGRAPRSRAKAALGTRGRIREPAERWTSARTIRTPLPPPSRRRRDPSERRTGAASDCSRGSGRVSVSRRPTAFPAYFAPTMSGRRTTANDRRAA
jgi:hypothetical protein